MDSRYTFTTRRHADYYEVLGVPPDATGRQIEAAYWRRAHEAAAPEQRRLLNEAFEALGHPERRQAYDAERATAGVVKRRAALVSQEGTGLEGRLRDRLNFSP